MAGVMRVSVVATGIDAAARAEQEPVPARRVAEPIAAPRVLAPAERVAERAAEPAPQPQPVVARTPSFADAQQGAEEDEAGFAADDLLSEPQGVPQPAAVQRTAPYGQPKIDQNAVRRPGDPSPDALRRLQAAVQNVPKAAPMVRPVGTTTRDVVSSSRLTINSLIHKMTGQAARDPATPPRARAAEPGFEPQAEPLAGPDFEDTERERVDIPAFLRRQAN
jgi:cell division protein FtsZ